MQHRISVTIDLEGDAYKAHRLRATIEEAAGLQNGSVESTEVERIDLDFDGGDWRAFLLDSLECWCGAKAGYASPTVPSDGTFHPTCIEHSQDGYVGLEQHSEDDICALLGVE